MALVLVLGALLILAGVVLLINLFGAADYVMSRVTTRSLGELAPGFAASRRGFRIYAGLIVAVGVVCVGIGLLGRNIPVAAVVIVLGAVLFGIASVVAITGEVETYRALKR
ncbi:MAG TPA: hypothetical protein VJT78_06575 [Candidatus Dormibacteraeota bacterium]|nr:hypothetical protein [Candidatus Dormibacteraeota bacterium]